MQVTRDIEKYAKDYVADDNDFEKILVQYRRKKVLEILEQGSYFIKPFNHAKMAQLIKRNDR